MLCEKSGDGQRKEKVTLRMTEKEEQRKREDGIRTRSRSLLLAHTDEHFEHRDLTEERGYS